MAEKPDDLVIRLDRIASRMRNGFSDDGHEDDITLTEAANEIVMLRARLAELETMVGDLREQLEPPYDDGPDDYPTLDASEMFRG